MFRFNEETLKMVDVKKRKIEQKVTVNQGEGKHTTINHSLAVCNSIANTKKKNHCLQQEMILSIILMSQQRIHKETVAQAPETSNYNIYMLFPCKELLRADQCRREGSDSESRPRGRGYEPHWHQWVVSLSKTHLS